MAEVGVLAANIEEGDRCVDAHQLQARNEPDAISRCTTLLAWIEIPTPASTACFTR